jgi:hypothetical protein
MRKMAYLIILAACVLTMSCQTVKPYQRIYLNDHEMNAGISEAASFDYEFQAYREGATGGRGSKGSGGCGCN